MISAVVFDLGETLLDDTREWAAWADWLRVPCHLSSSVVGPSSRSNQTARVGDLLRGLDLPVDAIATSAEWGVGKPRRGFFERVVSMAPPCTSETTAPTIS